MSRPYRGPLTNSTRLHIKTKSNSTAENGGRASSTGKTAVGDSAPSWPVSFSFHRIETFVEYAHFFRFLAAQDRRGISTCQRPKVYIQFDEIWGNEPIWKKSENKVTNNVKYQKESAAVIIADWWAADRELSFFIIGREKKEKKKRFSTSSYCPAVGGNILGRPHCVGNTPPFILFFRPCASWWSCIHSWSRDVRRSPYPTISRSWSTYFRRHP